MLVESLIGAATLASAALAAPTIPTQVYAPSTNGSSNSTSSSGPYSPKVMIVSMFTPEREVWLQPLNLTNNVSFVGASPLFPYVACNANYSTCIVTTGESQFHKISQINRCRGSPSEGSRAYPLLNDTICPVLTVNPALSVSESVLS
ncbi:hypothetical protein JCM3765_000286 [Sporobolomyces pararoseus]